MANKIALEIVEYNASQEAEDKANSRPWSH